MSGRLRTRVRISWSLLIALGIAATVVLVSSLPAGAGKGGVGIPDLSLDSARLASSARLETGTFSPTSCEVQEACVGSAGIRRLLRFDVVVRNTGTGDLVLGNPANNPLFVYSPCHQHYHFENFATYELVGVTNKARKQAFCLEDYEPIPGYPNTGRKYACNKQGISVGWQDTYVSTLPCQWLDVTGVLPGTYTLRVTIDPNNLIPETNDNNNIGQATVTIR